MLQLVIWGSENEPPLCIVPIFLTIVPLHRILTIVVLLSEFFADYGPVVKFGMLALPTLTEISYCHSVTTYDFCFLIRNDRGAALAAHITRAIKPTTQLTFTVRFQDTEVGDLQELTPSLLKLPFCSRGGELLCNRWLILSWLVLEGYFLLTA